MYEVLDFNSRDIASGPDSHGVLFRLQKHFGLGSGNIVVLDKSQKKSNASCV